MPRIERGAGPGISPWIMRNVNWNYRMQVDPAKGVGVGLSNNRNALITVEQKGNNGRGGSADIQSTVEVVVFSAPKEAESSQEP